MNPTPTLLNDDGSASMATFLLMVHHGLRRDLARFRHALRGSGGDLAALTAEWASYRATLHGHHEAEDGGIFPGLKAKNASLEPVIAGLTADHRQIDPLLERGDAAFARIADDRRDAAGVVEELRALLDRHLATEEANVVPFLRSVATFAMPVEGDAQAEMFAGGFAWSSHGVAPDVLAKAYALVPEAITSRIPAARAAFEARCARVWGTASAGASRTAVPDWIEG